MNTQPIQQVADALPPTAVLILIGLVIVGLVLWLIGRKLARPACAVSGLVLGGLFGLFVAGEFAGQGAYTLPLVLGGAILGAVLAAVLFRVWMGLSAAVILALVAPAVSIVWQGTPPPPLELHAPSEQVGDQAGAQTRSSPSDAADAKGRSDSHADPLGQFIHDVEKQVRATHTDASSVSSDAGTASTAEQPGLITTLTDRAGETYESQSQAIAKWWDNLSTSAKWVLLLAAGIGAVVGLLLGLIAPYVTAAIESALVGAILIFFAGQTLWATYLPDQIAWLPDTPRSILLTVALMTLAGVVIQQAIFHRRRRDG